MKHYGSCGFDVRYEIDTVSGIAIISGSGYMNNYEKKYKTLIYDPIRIVEAISPFELYSRFIKSIIVKDSVETIGNRAFIGCKQLESVILPKKLSSIGEEAFRGCAKLRIINLPPNICKIGERAFCECESLETLAFPKSLISMEIGYQAFYYCKELRKIALPPTFSEIGEAAFDFCKSLEEIRLPAGIKRIGENAFEYCNSLKKVYFDGSAEEWQRIDIESNGEPVWLGGNATLYKAEKVFAK